MKRDRRRGRERFDKLGGSFFRGYIHGRGLGVPREAARVIIAYIMQWDYLLAPGGKSIGVGKGRCWFVCPWLGCKFSTDPAQMSVVVLSWSIYMTHSPGKHAMFPPTPGSNPSVMNGPSPRVSGYCLHFNACKLYSLIPGTLHGCQDLPRVIPELSGIIRSNSSGQLV